MSMNEEIKVLHCDPRCVGRWARTGYTGERSSQPMTGKLKPVHRRTTIISLPHACLACDLLEHRAKDKRVDFEALSTQAASKWRNNTDLFFRDAARLNVDPDSIARRAQAFSGAIIGWAARTIKSVASLGICTDLELTLVLLSRRVGDIFISTRDPDYSWDVLFASPFEIDDDIGSAPRLDHEPWKRYKW